MYHKEIYDDYYNTEYNINFIFEHRCHEYNTKMESWKKITFFVAVFAFVREFRPIEPFYAAYMTSPYINCTVEQVRYYILILLVS